MHSREFPNIETENLKFVSNVWKISFEMWTEEKDDVEKIFYISDKQIELRLKFDCIFSAKFQSNEKKKRLTFSIEATTNTRSFNSNIVHKSNCRYNLKPVFASF